MKNTEELKESRIANAWAELQSHAVLGHELDADTYRLAFADPQFMLRRETRGLRMQLEMLKPELELQKLGIESTVVVYGSARFISPNEAKKKLQTAQSSGDELALQNAQRDVHNAHYYHQARLFARLVASYGGKGGNNVGGSNGAANDKKKSSSTDDKGSKPSEERIYICTGGGPGIMEAANRGAHDVGALSIGLNITLPHEQTGNRFITPSLNFKFHYFALRKMHFMMRAKALVAFPGGMGTLDELFEVLTLVQTRKAQPVPIILFGTEYWKKLIDFDLMVAEGTISKEDLDFFTYTDDPQEAWDTIKTFYKLT